MQGTIGKEVKEISPVKVIIKKDLQRIRQEDGDIGELVKSIQDIGQLAPIVLTENLELVAGWRRLQACKTLKQDVRYIVASDHTDLTLRFIEIEENLRRKAFTPAEELMATREYHKQMQALKGETTKGVTGGHTLQNTADALNVSKGTVIRNLELASVIDAIPALQFATKKSEISQAKKKLELANRAIDGLKLIKESAGKETTYKLFNTPCVEHIKTMADKSIDIILSDPYYGFEHDKTQYAKTANAGHRMEDTKELQSTIDMLQAVQPKVKSTSHIYLFVAPEFFHSVKYAMQQTGWEVFVKPIIWIKRTSGQCNIPDKWPSSCYEMLLYGRMPDAKLSKPGMADWVQCDPVSSPIHSYQKPIPLLKNLLIRVGIPGLLVFDPFCGVGSTLKAAKEMQMFSVGTEIDTLVFALANDFLKEE